MASSTILYAETNPVNQTTTNANFVDMAGLTLTLPAANANEKQALVILDIPNPYAIGTNFPGANFKLKVNNVLQTPIACFTYFVQNLPGSSGRMPTTLVGRVKLGSAATTVQAVWQSVRNSKVIVDTPCSISAILGV